MKDPQWRGLIVIEWLARLFGPRPQPPAEDHVWADDSKKRDKSLGDKG